MLAQHSPATCQFSPLNFRRGFAAQVLTVYSVYTTDRKTHVPEVSRCDQSVSLRMFVCIECNSCRWWRWKPREGWDQGGLLCSESRLQFQHRFIVYTHIFVCSCIMLYLLLILIDRLIANWTKLIHWYCIYTYIRMIGVERCWLLICWWMVVHVHFSKKNHCFGHPAIPSLHFPAWF